MICTVANCLWLASNLQRWSAFRATLRDPAQAQRDVLAGILRRNADSDAGRRLGFADIASPAAFRERVPIADREALATDIERIRRGEASVLTSEPVQRLMPTSGSTSARKLVPYTQTLLDEYQRAIGPWIVDMFHRRPTLMHGRAYWSVSPAIPDDPAAPGSSVPIGFDDDTEYLARWTRPLIAATLAVPSSVRNIAEPDTFRYLTSLFLMRADDLRLISIWHPSFLTLLLQHMSCNWDRLVHDIRRGGVSGCPGSVLPASVLREFRLIPNARRADELDRIGPAHAKSIWPRLDVVSCWTHGFAALSIPPLREMLGHVAILPKGLLATEAIVTIPFAEHHPLALRSHFFEFLDDAGNAHFAHELDAGGEYTVVVTTGGGLYRYPLGDRVRVDAFVDRAPSLTFLGRGDRISDRRGEKLNDAFVAGVLAVALASLEIQPAFVMLAPHDEAGHCRYVLFIECECADWQMLAQRIDKCLRENPQYDLCRRLGQLEMLAIFRITRDASQTYLAHRAGHQLMGGVKPAALSTDDAWHTRFNGAFATMARV